MKDGDSTLKKGTKIKKGHRQAGFKWPKDQGYSRNETSHLASFYVKWTMLKEK